MDKKASKDLKSYFPEEIIIGPYTYKLVIENLSKQFAHGLCDYEERKITLSSDLNYDLDKPNALYSLEVLLHECLHGYNYNSGLRQRNWKNVKNEDIEEEFVDHIARHIVQLIKENPSIIKLFSLFEK